jgi:hypothetical protein
MGWNVTHMGLEKKQGTHEIKKHAATIHCSNTLSLLQRKISNALLYHAYKELMSKEEHEINVKQLCNLISYSGNNHAAIKDALKGLLSTVIEWNLVNDTTGQEDWTASSILASVSLQGPLCYYAYSPRMKQLLHSPSMFGKINLFIQSRFKSSYGLALYENCIRYRGLAHTKWFDMELFRKLMGVPAGKYTIFRDFKRRVLDKSIEEVNTYSDLIVESELFREGRQVNKIRFLLKERAKKTRLGGPQSTEEDVLIETGSDLKSKLMDHYNLLSEQCDQLLIEYGPDFIKEKINIIESSPNYQKGRVQNLPAYLMSALKNNYQSAKPLRVKVQEKKKQAIHNEKQLQRIIDQIKENYLNYREQMTDAVIEDLTLAEKQSFLESFTQFAAKPIQTILKIQRNKYTPETVLKSPQIKVLMRQFAFQELHDLQTMLLPLEQFIQTLPKDQQQAWQQFHRQTLIEQKELEVE